MRENTLTARYAGLTPVRIQEALFIGRSLERLRRFQEVVDEIQKNGYNASEFFTDAPEIDTDIGLASDFLGNLPQVATLPQSNGADCPPMFSLGITQQGFPIDLSVTFISRRGIAIALRYDEKTMNAPEVLEKSNVPQTIEPYVESIPFIYVSRQRVANGSLDKQNYIFGIEAIVKKGTLIDEQYESVIQDIFDNVDVDDVIPEKHYECIADIFARVYHLCDEAESRRRKWTGEVLSQEDIEALLGITAKSPDGVIPSNT